MARTTRAQRIEHENEQQAFACFVSLMQSLRDPSCAQGRRYPLPVVILVALLASVCGCDNAESMQQWGEDNEPWLSQFLEMPHGTPS